ncbi:MAG TPA: hypothetical protein VGA22_10320 [Gemmatimonadales bacterium]
MNVTRWASALALGTMVTACVSRSEPVDAIAADYVKAALALGQHDPDFVDAYYGPQEWRAEVEADAPSVVEIRGRAEAARSALSVLPERPSDDDGQRRRFLDRHLAALIARAEMVEGRALNFDQESELLYDAVAPTHDEEYFAALTAGLDSALPGAGPLADRLARFRQDFVVPSARVDTVFRAAIRECRVRTIRWLALPDDESFTVEYVTDKSWSGYNWYQGGHASLIQVNTDLPIHIDRAVDLACHEGYPGHHVLNVLLESHLVEQRGWMEYSIYPLFSPVSLIAEGSANFGVAMAFPGDERTVFERDILYPLAGLDPRRAVAYREVMDLVGRLSYAGNEAARRYLDGAIDADGAAAWLERYALMTPERARQRVRFFDQYRSYVINYNLGRDLVEEYVRRNSAGGGEERRWEVFGALLRMPLLPSQLVP